MVEGQSYIPSDKERQIDEKFFMTRQQQIDSKEREDTHYEAKAELFITKEQKIASQVRKDAYSAGSQAEKEIINKEVEKRYIDLSLNILSLNKEISTPINNEEKKQKKKIIEKMRKLFAEKELIDDLYMSFGHDSLGTQDKITEEIEERAKSPKPN